MAELEVEEARLGRVPACATMLRNAQRAALRRHLSPVLMKRQRG
jgi:hypothetical protein